MPHFKCQTELFHSTNLPSLRRRLFSIGLFVPYCTNLFLNVHLAWKGQNTHTDSGHCYFFLAPSGWIDSYSIWYVALLSVSQSLFSLDGHWVFLGHSRQQSLYSPTWRCTPPAICPSICLPLIILPFFPHRYWISS